MQRRTPTNSISSSGLFTSFSSSIVGIILILLCLIIFSYVMTKIDVSDELTSVMSSLAICIGAYTGGYIASKRRRRNGLVLGALTGLIIFFIIFFAGIFFAKSSISFGFVSKLIMTVICAAVGGIIGVNSKGKRY